ncbi:MAG: helix-turn-helix domain-containing protein [Oscillospiraceae bacterium]|nr:helix-turn-helix domain-containing protein [Oscillospiraceae bacterium]
MDIRKFAELITERRKELGLTQADLGRQLGVTDKAVSKWERSICYPDISVIHPLSAALHLNIEEILGEHIGDIAQSSNIHNHEPIPEIENLLNAPVTLTEEPTSIPVSPLLFGCNLEHTRSCIYTGLSAQMLRNRKFAGKPSACSGHAAEWYPIGSDAIFLFDQSYTQHHKQYHMKRNHERNSQRIVNPYEGAVCGIGQHELLIQQDVSYSFRIVAKASAPVILTVSLTSRHGKVTYASNQITIRHPDWADYSVCLTPTESDEDADIRITFSEESSLCIGAISLMPSENFHGMRWDVIDTLKEIGIKLLRWPGGNFAGEYNWMDGLLPVDMRSPLESCMGIETQPHTLGYDFHEINTDDFIALCREIGAEPFITINPCWNTPEETAAWVEYCNGDETTSYGSLRAQRGSPEPYRVRFWSLGNEIGFGHMEGENTPDGYCKIAKEHGTQMLSVSPDLTLCSSGPYPNSLWTKNSAIPLRGVSNLISYHFYAHNPSYPDTENFSQEYYACLSGAFRMKDRLIFTRKSLPDDIHISLDEWNVWYAWYRPSSVTDGIFSALAFHAIFGEADPCGIDLACHFEAINEGLLCVTPDRVFLTAQGQVFSIMKNHLGGQICYYRPDALSTRHNNKIVSTVVNGSYDRTKKVIFPKDRTVCQLKLLFSETVLPPSFFETSEFSEDCLANMTEFTMPAHSILLITWEG